MNFFAPKAMSSDADPLAAFGAEGSSKPAAPAASGSVKSWGIIALAIAILAGAPYSAYRYKRAMLPGTLQIESTPAAAQVSVDGVVQGTTPATLSVAPGDHQVLVRAGQQQVSLTLRARAGETLRQTVSFDGPASVKQSAGLVITTEPAGIPVVIDGTDRGPSPVTLNDLAQGSHEIRANFPSAPVRRLVDLQEGERLSLVMTPAPLAAAARSIGGWLTVSSAIPLRIYERGELIGSSDASRVMLPSGAHALELRNDEFAFRETRQVQIAEAKTQAIAIALPKSVLHINAVPWAEVAIDGTKAGETPIGNFSLPIGMHDVVFTHPQYGQRRQTVAVKASGPARVAVDFTKRP